MSVTPYLFFDGNCAEAMRAYERILGGKLEVMTYREGPEGSCPEAKLDSVMHACLTLPDGNHIFASDDMSTVPYKGMNGFAVAIDYREACEVKRVFEALAGGGQIVMPLEKVFWTELFGVLVDRYGASWMVSTEGTGADSSK